MPIFLDGLNQSMQGQPSAYNLPQSVNNPDALTNLTDITNKDYTKYSPYFNGNMPGNLHAVKELAALNQDRFYQGFASLAQGTNTFLQFVPGMVGGVLALGDLALKGLTGQISSGTDALNVFTENPILKASSDWVDYFNEELMPVHRTEGSQKGLNYYTSMGFLNDALNGVGFLAQNIIPGKMIGTAGSMLGSYRANQVRNRLLSMADGTLDIAEDINKANKIKSYYDKLSIPVAGMFSRLTESAIESHGVEKELKMKLQELVDNRVITKEEMENRLKQAKATTFGLNMLLSLSDMGQLARLHKPPIIKGFFNESKDKALEDSFKIVNKNGIYERAFKGDRLTKLIGDRTTYGLKRVGREALQEAAEEGIQHSISEASQRVALNRENKNYYNSLVEEIQKAGVKTLTSEDGWKAMVLGGLLGGGMRLFNSPISKSAFSEYDDKLKKTNENVNDLNEISKFNTDKFYNVNERKLRNAYLESIKDKTDIITNKITDLQNQKSKAKKSEQFKYDNKIESLNNLLNNIANISVNRFIFKDPKGNNIDITNKEELTKKIKDLEDRKKKLQLEIAKESDKDKKKLKTVSLKQVNSSLKKGYDYLNQSDVLNELGIKKEDLKQSKKKLFEENFSPKDFGFSKDKYDDLSNDEKKQFHSNIKTKMKEIDKKLRTDQKYKTLTNKLLNGKLTNKEKEKVAKQIEETLKEKYSNSEQAHKFLPQIEQADSLLKIINLKKESLNKMKEENKIDEDNYNETLKEIENKEKEINTFKENYVKNAKEEDYRYRLNKDFVSNFNKLEDLEYQKEQILLNDQLDSDQKRTEWFRLNKLQLYHKMFYHSKAGNAENLIKEEELKLKKSDDELNKLTSSKNGRKIIQDNINDLKEANELFMSMKTDPIFSNVYSTKDKEQSEYLKSMLIDFVVTQKNFKNAKNDFKRQIDKIIQNKREITPEEFKRKELLTSRIKELDVNNKNIEVEKRKEIVFKELALERDKVNPDKTKIKSLKEELKSLDKRDKSIYELAKTTLDTRKKMFDLDNLDKSLKLRFSKDKIKELDQSINLKSIQSNLDLLGDSFDKSIEQLNKSIEEIGNKPTSIDTLKELEDLEKKREDKLSRLNKLSEIKNKKDKEDEKYTYAYEATKFLDENKDTLEEKTFNEVSTLLEAKTKLENEITNNNSKLDLAIKERNELKDQLDSVLSQYEGVPQDQLPEEVKLLNKDYLDKNNEVITLSNYNIEAKQKEIEALEEEAEQRVITFFNEKDLSVNELNKIIYGIKNKTLSNITKSPFSYDSKILKLVNESQTDIDKLKNNELEYLNKLEELFPTKDKQMLNEQDKETPAAYLKYLDMMNQKDRFKKELDELESDEYYLDDVNKQKLKKLKLYSEQSDKLLKQISDEYKSLRNVKSKLSKALQEKIKQGEPNSMEEELRNAIYAERQKIYEEDRKSKNIIQASIKLRVKALRDYLTSLKDAYNNEFLSDESYENKVFITKFLNEFFNDNMDKALLFNFKFESVNLVLPQVEKNNKKYYEITLKNGETKKIELMKKNNEYYNHIEESIAKLIKIADDKVAQFMTTPSLNIEAFTYLSEYFLNLNNELSNNTQKEYSEKKESLFFIKEAIEKKIKGLYDLLDNDKIKDISDQLEEEKNNVDSQIALYEKELEILQNNYLLTTNYNDVLNNLKSKIKEKEDVIYKIKSNAKINNNNIIKTLFKKITKTNNLLTKNEIEKIKELENEIKDLETQVSNLKDKLLREGIIKESEYNEAKSNIKDLINKLNKAILNLPKKYDVNTTFEKLNEANKGKKDVKYTSKTNEEAYDVYKELLQDINNAFTFLYKLQNDIDLTQVFEDVVKNKNTNSLFWQDLKRINEIENNTELIFQESLKLKANMVNFFKNALKSYDSTLKLFENDQYVMNKVMYDNLKEQLNEELKGLEEIKNARPSPKLIEILEMKDKLEQLRLEKDIIENEVRFNIKSKTYDIISKNLKDKGKQQDSFEIYGKLYSESVFNMVSEQDVLNSNMDFLTLSSPTSSMLNRTTGNQQFLTKSDINNSMLNISSQALWAEFMTSEIDPNTQLVVETKKYNDQDVLVVIPTLNGKPINPKLLTTLPDPFFKISDENLRKVQPILSDIETNGDNVNKSLFLKIKNGDANMYNALIKAIFTMGNRIYKEDKTLKDNIIETLINEINQIEKNRKEIFEALKNNKVVTYKINELSNGVYNYGKTTNKVKDLFEGDFNIDISRTDEPIIIGNEKQMKTKYKFPKGTVFAYQGTKAFPLITDKLNSKEAEIAVKLIFALSQGEEFNERINISYEGSDTLYTSNIITKRDKLSKEETKLGLLDLLLYWNVPEEMKIQNNQSVFLSGGYLHYGYELERKDNTTIMRKKKVLASELMKDGKLTAIGEQVANYLKLNALRPYNDKFNSLKQINIPVDVKFTADNKLDKVIVKTYSASEDKSKTAYNNYMQFRLSSKVVPIKSSKFQITNRHFKLGDRLITDAPIQNNSTNSTSSNTGGTDLNKSPFNSALIKNIFGIDLGQMETEFYLPTDSSENPPVVAPFSKDISYFDLFGTVGAIKERRDSFLGKENRRFDESGFNKGSNGVNSKGDQIYFKLESSLDSLYNKDLFFDEKELKFKVKDTKDFMLKNLKINKQILSVITLYETMDKLKLNPSKELKELYDKIMKEVNNIPSRTDLDLNAKKKYAYLVSLMLETENDINKLMDSNHNKIKEDIDKLRNYKPNNENKKDDENLPPEDFFNPDDNPPLPFIDNEEMTDEKITTILNESLTKLTTEEIQNVLNELELYKTEEEDNTIEDTIVSALDDGIVSIEIENHKSDNKLKKLILNIERDKYTDSISITGLNSLANRLDYIIKLKDYQKEKEKNQSNTQNTNQPKQEFQPNYQPPQNENTETEEDEDFLDDVDDENIYDSLKNEKENKPKEETSSTESNNLKQIKIKNSVYTVIDTKDPNVKEVIQKIEAANVTSEIYWELTNNNGKVEMRYKSDKGVPSLLFSNPFYISTQEIIDFANNNGENNETLGEKLFYLNQTNDVETTINQQDIISDEIYNDFIDNNKVSDDTLNSISNKVINRELLSSRETAIYSGKISEINEIIKSKYNQTSNLSNQNEQSQQPKITTNNEDKLIVDGKEIVSDTDVLDDILRVSQEDIDDLNDIEGNESLKQYRIENLKNQNLIKNAKSISVPQEYISQIQDLLNQQSQQTETQQVNLQETELIDNYLIEKQLLDGNHYYYYINQDYTEKDKPVLITKDNIKEAIQLDKANKPDGVIVEKQGKKYYLIGDLTEPLIKFGDNSSYMEIYGTKDLLSFINDATTTSEEKEKAIQLYNELKEKAGINKQPNLQQVPAITPELLELQERGEAIVLQKEKSTLFNNPFIDEDSFVRWLKSDSKTAQFSKERNWIKENISKFKGKPIYYTPGNEEHAQTVNRLINGKPTQQPAPTQQSTPSSQITQSEQPVTQTNEQAQTPKVVKNEEGLIIINNAISPEQSVKIVEQSKNLIQETSFKQTAGSVSWGHGLQWMRVNAMTPKQKQGIVTGKQLNGKEITEKMKQDLIAGKAVYNLPLYAYTEFDIHGNKLPPIPNEIITMLTDMGIDISEYDASYNSVYDKADNGSLIIHQDNTETNKSPIITISLGRPMKFITYELTDPNDFNIADSNNTAYRIAVNTIEAEGIKTGVIPKQFIKNNKVVYGHLTPSTLIQYAKAIDKKTGKTKLEDFVKDSLKAQFKDSVKSEYLLENGAVLVFSGNNRNVLHEIVFDEETNQLPMPSGFPELTVNKAFKGLGHADKFVKTNDYRVVLTLRKVKGNTVNNVDETKLVSSTQTTQQQLIQEPTNELGVTVTSIPYTKQTANDKSKGFFFSENLQAYLANRGRGSEVRFDLHSNDVELDVTATNNQAGIRRTNGTRNLNAFAIISKKFQQNGKGLFVAEEGQFKDTDEDFELFKKYNSEAIQEALNSKLPLNIPNSGIATGKSALPLRFAEWLNKELETKLGVSGTIKENTSKGYKGYGIFDIKTSKTTQQPQTSTLQQVDDITDKMLEAQEKSEAVVLGEFEFKRADIERGRKEELNNLDGVKNTAKVIEGIENGDNKSFKELIKVLVNNFNLKNVATNFVTTLQSYFGVPAGGDYSRGVITINVNSNNNQQQTFIHEAIHSVTKTKLDLYNGGQKDKLSKEDIIAIENLYRIYEKVQKELLNLKSSRGTAIFKDLSPHYGFTNIDEFLSESFSNPEFQKLLSNIKGEGKTPNLFKQFLDVLASLLGISNSTILNDIFAWTEQFATSPILTDDIAEINAKYDAELSALEQQTNSFNNPFKTEQALLNENVSKLFESNPELANVVYEALGFINNIEFSKVVSLIADEKNYIGGSAGLFQQKLLNRTPNDIDLMSFEDNIDDLITKLKSKGLEINKISNKSLLVNNVEVNIDFLNKDVLNSKEEFIKGFPLSEQFLKEGKINPDYLLAIKKIENRDKDISDLKNQITPQQKQQAQRKFQEYINNTGKTDIEGFKQWLNKPLGTINVYWGQAESDTSTRILSNLAQPKKEPIITPQPENTNVNTQKSETQSEGTYNVFDKLNSVLAEVKKMAQEEQNKVADVTKEQIEADKKENQQNKGEPINNAIGKDGNTTADNMIKICS